MSYLTTFIFIIIGQFVGILVHSVGDILSYPFSQNKEMLEARNVKYGLKLAISTIIRLAVCLTFAALVISFLIDRCNSENLIKWIILPFGIIATILFPLEKVLSEASKNDNPDLEISIKALNIIRFILLLSSILFAVYPSSMKILWNWIPFVAQL